MLLSGMDITKQLLLKRTPIAFDLTCTIQQMTGRSRPILLKK